MRPASTEKQTVRLVAMDVDGTIVSCQSQELLVLYLAKRGLLPLRIVLAVLRWFLLYRLGIEQNHREIRRRVLRHLAGLSADEIWRISHEFVASVLRKKIRAEALREIERLKRQGYRIILVSASAEPIVESLARILGVDGHVATQLHIDKQTLSGDIEGNVVIGQEKLQRFLRHANAMFSDWELARAYGDHISDLEILQSAKTAVAVSPSRRLQRVARAKGWECKQW